jgi:hypothetical protein
MLLLTSTSDLVRVTTNASASVEVHASWMDNASGTITPGRTNTTAITTATTTTVVGSPGPSTQRNVKYLSIRNDHASTPVLTEVIHTDGTTIISLWEGTLNPQEQVIFSDGIWTRYDSAGSPVPGQDSTQLNDIHSGYSEYQAISNPSVPAADTLRFYARKISGRMFPKWIPPSGLDNPVQPALFGNNVIMYYPTSSTTVTGGFGTLWAKGSSAGTVDTPTPATTSPAIVNQMKRTRHRNVVTTTNQCMGITSIAAGMPQYWIGSATNVGGFFFFCRFIVEAWAANTCRLFVGLQSSATEVAISDTVLNDTVGLWHDTTDGANVLSIVTRNQATTTKTALSGGGQTLATGQAFDFYMFCKPGDTTIFYRLDDINAGTVLYDSSVTATLPTNTVFMGPAATMSNGTANTTVNTVGIGVNRIYVESDH